MSSREQNNVVSKMSYLVSFNTGIRGLWRNRGDPHIRGDTVTPGQSGLISKSGRKYGTGNEVGTTIPAAMNDKNLTKEKKMKALTKRLGVAIATAVLATAAFTGSAFAAATLTDDGTVGTSAGTALDKQIQIQKELIAYNPDETTIAAPEITYSYALTAGAAGKAVTDEDGIGALTKAGVLPTTTTASVIFNNEDITAAPAGHSNVRNFQFDFSSANYTSAGVYRYVITESTSVDKAAAGVTDGTISNIRYLDVYVRDPRTGETGFQIYGYSLFSANNDIDGTDTSDPSSVDAAAKTTGFVTGSDPADPAGDDLTGDQYYTFNETVSKTLVNDSAMNSHQFPFNVDFTNAAVTSNVLLKQTVSGTATGTTQSEGAVSSLDATPKIANGGSVKYIGIPNGTSVAVYETNDVNGTTYKSEYSIDSAAAAGTKSISWTGADAQSNTATTSTTANQTETAHTTAFTNTLELISPTGVVLRYGPFAAMLLGGIALLFVATRRRKESERF